MEKSEALIFWKTSNGREKRNEIWDVQAVVQRMWGNIGLVAFKVFLRSFSAL